MSEQKQQKTYINGNWICEKQFANGGNILTLSILPDRFIESLKAVKPNEDGFVRLVISKRLNPDEKSSHTMYVDTFVPNRQSAPETTSSPKVVKKTSTKKSEPAPESDGNDF